MADVVGFLEEAGLEFDVLEHAYTVRAVDEAAALGVEAEEVAKTLVLVASRGNVRAVPRSGSTCTRWPLSSAWAARRYAWRARMTSPATTRSSSWGGAAVRRPRGSGLVDEQLAGRDSVVVEAGSHDRSVRLKAGNLVRLTGAQVADIRREEPAAL
ncbi:MAG: hypothetical protein E6G31_11415 [Actinobacteria bacterium]|nr:MAG: hypothetical protein E6G31_11415 [Actinomycetota bacterium]